MANPAPQFTVNAGGAGPVIPSTTTPTPVVTNTIGLTTQLIIWGMVGFILLELLAIICLLRYCCRARFIKKRKFVEREIILANNNSDSLSKMPIIDTSDETGKAGRKPIVIGNQPDSVRAGGNLDDSHSYRPFTQQSIHNDTIMIDDITSVYSTTVNYPHNKRKPTKTVPAISQVTEINTPSIPPPSQAIMTTHQEYRTSHTYQPPPPPPPTNTHFDIHINTDTSGHLKAAVDTKYLDYNERMRQELSSEDIYTLRFSTSVPIEPFDTSAPREHQSYLYNGSVNRPAFEIVSHADMRPATPIKFEHVRELPVKHQSTNKINQAPQVDRSSKESDRRYHERMNLGPSGLESSSWVATTQSHTRRRRSLIKKTRSTNTSPIRLYYGSQENIVQSGEPVEWQMARELRTIDWERLKGLSGSENLPYQSSTIARSHLTDSDYKARRNYERNLGKDRTGRYSPDILYTKIGKQSRYNDLIDSVDTNDSNNSRRNRQDNRFSSSSNSSSNYNHNYNHKLKNTSLLLNEKMNASKLNSYETNNQRIKNKSSEFISNHNEQSSTSSSNGETKNLFISKEIKGNYEKNNTKRRGSSSQSQDDSNGGDFGRKITNKKRDAERDRNNGSQPIILTKIIRDPDTNEILSKINLNDSNTLSSRNKTKNYKNSYNVSGGGGGSSGGDAAYDLKRTRINNSNTSVLLEEDNNNLDRSNVSIIDVTYNPTNNQQSQHIRQMSESSLPDLPPPTQFQLSLNDTSKPHSFLSINKIEDDHKSRRASVANSIGARRHENEDFRSSHEINIEDDAISVKTHNIPNLDSPDHITSLNEHFKLLDRLASEEREAHKSFRELNKSFLTESQKDIRDSNINNRIDNSFGNVMNDIRNFSNEKLKSSKEAPIKENTPSNLNVKNDGLNHAPPAPPPPPLIITSKNTKKQIDDDRISVASSTILSTNSAHLY